MEAEALEMGVMALGESGSRNEGQGRTPGEQPPLSVGGGEEAEEAREDEGPGDPRVSGACGGGAFRKGRADRAEMEGQQGQERP